MNLPRKTRFIELRMLKAVPIAIAVLIVTLLAVDSLDKVDHKEDVVASVLPPYVFAEVASWACRKRNDYLLMWLLRATHVALKLCSAQLRVMLRSSTVTARCQAAFFPLFSSAQDYLAC